MKRLLSAALGCVMLLSVTACSSAEPAKDKVRVSVSFNALKEFTEAVGDIYTSSLIALGLILFVITFIIAGVVFSTSNKWVNYDLN